MNKIKVLSIVGTRPEAIKMAPVILGLQKNEAFESTVCLTGQHRELLDQVISLFNIRPDIDLDLMRSNQSLRGLTVNVLNHLEKVYIDVKPDWVLVQGDTTTVMSASLLAYYHQIKIGHVEAGLRTYDIFQPFPEEVNRRIAGIVASLHFAPTEAAANNLLREGVPQKNVIVTGNTVIDAIKQVAKMPFDVKQSSLQELPEEKPIILITAHRRENFGEPLENICKAILSLADEYGDKFQFVYPVHPNPNVRDIVIPALKKNNAITLLPPVPYRELVYLINRAVFIISDSGGIQEEAPALKKPVLVLREKTERPEGVDAGISRLVGTNTEKIYKIASNLIENPAERDRMMNVKNPYGDGLATERILASLKEYTTFL